MEVRYRLALIAACLLIPVFIGASVGIDMDSGRVTDWLPQGRPTRIAYDRFVEQFGTDDYVILSWPGCTLDNPCVEKLADALRTRPEGRGLIDQVTSGPEILRELTSPPRRLARKEALHRLEGIFVGPDHETTCLSIRTTGTPAERQEAFKVICQIARDVCGLTRSDLRVAGSTFQAVALDEASARTVRLYAVPAGIVSLLFAGLFLQRIRTTIAILAVSVFCQLMAIGVLDVTLGRMNVILIMMPTLMYVLTMSGAVHLVNYCLDASRSRGLCAGVPRGIREGRIPCIMAAVTTVIGLLSLCVSQIRPVREFGLLSAICLLLSLAWLFLLLPPLLLWGVAPGNDVIRCRPSKFLHRFQSGVNAMGAFVEAHPVMTATVSLLLIAAGSGGLMKLRTQVDFDRMFPPDSEIVRNFVWLESHLGPLVPIEVLVDIPVESRMNSLERIELIGEIERAVGQLPDVQGTMSAATFVPQRPEEFHLRELIARRLKVERIAEQIPGFIEDDLLAIDGGLQRWRISFRVPASGKSDYRGIARAATSEARAVISSRPESSEEDIAVTSTGMMPVTNETNAQLFEDLASSYLMAFALICPLMMLILRGFLAGLVAMIPNVIPTTFVFGLMGWIDEPVDIGTVLCASVALGMAVDDTVHFLTWFRRGSADGKSRIDAVRYAYDHCSIAMVQSTLICCSGMLVFGLSDFSPASRFAVMLSALLMVALYGDMVVLPALLCSPVGRIFERARCVSDSARS